MRLGQAGWAALLAVLGGCYIEHQVTDGSGRDGGPDGAAPCTWDGWPASALRDFHEDLAGCECGAGLRASVAFFAPAPIASRGTIGICAPWSDSDPGGAMCEFGLVAYVDPDYQAEMAGFAFAQDCISPELCLYAESHMPEAMRGHCLYADFTPAVTGVVPSISEAECERLRGLGLCGDQCGCLGEDQRCWGYSETHPVGVCARLEFCFGEMMWCDDPDDACARPVHRPEYFERSEFAYPFGPDGDTHAGRCAPRAACEAFASEAPGVWSCLELE